MIKKVLITGATGFVGFHLIKKCLAEGYEVYAAVREYSDKRHIKELPLSYIDLDYSSVDNLRSQLEKLGCSYIIHAAGTTKAKTKADYNKVNAAYSTNLALAASSTSFNLDKFIFVSSLAALGPLKDLSKKLSSRSEGYPVTNYGTSKLLAEKQLAEISNLPLIVIRPTAVYGPREKDLFILFTSIKRGLEPYIGKFNQQLSFIYVSDLAKVIVDALSSPFIGKTYNISDGITYDRYALALAIKKSLSIKTIKFHLPIAAVNLFASIMDLLYTRSKNTPTLNKEKMAELTAINWACDIEDAVRDLQFKPEFDLEKGIKETTDWYLANKWL
ncbi:MAG: NAD(P)-dependent oxidoreductase [Bacteroidota bacterium]